MYILYNNDEKKNIIEAPNYNIENNTIEVHYDNFTGANSSGFKLVNDNDVVMDDCSEYTTLWNVLTPLEDGAVYSKDGTVETEDNRLFVPTKEQKEQWAKEELMQSIIENSKLTDEDRLADIESAICELYELLG